MRLALTMCVILVFGCGMIGVPAPSGPTAASAPTKKVYSRDELRKLLLGKTKEEVIQLLGKPDTTSEGGEWELTWNYQEISQDPVAKQKDLFASVRFSGDKVVSVDY